MYPQLNGRDHVPIQSVTINLSEDSLETIAYELDRFEKLIAEYGPTIFYGGYTPTIILAS
jgi:hypothetical protein